MGTSMAYGHDCSARYVPSCTRLPRARELEAESARSNNQISIHLPFADQTTSFLLRSLVHGVDKKYTSSRSTTAACCLQLLRL